MDKKGIGRATKVKGSERPSQQNAIGKRVKIFWDGENQWFFGTIINHDARVDEYQVVYDLDGQTTWERYDDIVFLSPEEQYQPLPTQQSLPYLQEDEIYQPKRPRKQLDDTTSKRRKLVSDSDQSLDSDDANQDYSDSSASDDDSDSSNQSDDSASNSDKKSAIAKRRKGTTRAKPKNSYKDDMDTEDSESHEKPKKKQIRKNKKSDDDVDEPEDNSPDLILGMRTSDKNEPEFLVKFKGKSYRNCQWMSQFEFETKYPLSKGRLKKFTQTDIKHPPRYVNNNKVYFNNDYIIVDSVLDEMDSPEGKKYLVKWRGLAFESSTWELDSDLSTKEDRERVEDFQRHRTDLLKNSKKYQAASKVANARPPLHVGQIRAPTWRSTQFELKDFQVDGFTWLAFNWHQHRNCMLADEMGLGKTVQTISLLQYMYQRYEIHGPFLIVSPLSTLGNWFKEFRRWTNMHAIVFHGTKQSRDVIKEHCWNLKDNKGSIVKGVYQFDVIITSYEMVLTESKLLQTVDWHCLVLDEGHRIKNTDSKSLGKLKSFKASHKVILTGTPLQNNLKELWTMLNFLDEATFESCDNFLKEYSNLTTKESVESLHKLLAPYLLRRLKEDVDKSIPVKEETLIEVELTSIQKAYYRAVLDRNREFLARGVKSKSNMPKLTNILMQLRKICNHPFLIKGAEEYVVSHQQGMEVKPTVEVNTVQCSGKMVLLDKLLPKLKEGNHKVLIFSQMVMMLDIVEDYLLYRGYKYERIDGTVRGSERQERIDRFCDSGSNDDSFVFLCTTRAGGVGINLTVADTVIIFDSDWNPQNDLQAQSRCHRIGQTSNVKVYRLITRNTYERHMFDVASKKLQLDHTVLSANAASSLQEKPEEGIEKVTDGKQVEQMLRLNAMQLFNESNAEESEKERIMLEEDIDSILKRASTITYSTQSDENNNNNANFAAFAKVTFAASDRENHVELDDAHFWDKIMPQQQQGVSYLRQLLANTAALQTKEGKDVLASQIAKETQQLKHMNEVLDLMFQRLGDKEVENKDNELTQMVTLLDDVETMGIFDAPEHLSILKQCKAALDRPRLRGRKKRNIADNLYDQIQDSHELDASGSQTNLAEDNKKKKKKDFSDDEYEGESDDEGSDGTSDAKGAPGGYQWHTSGSPWRKVHRDKLKSTILQFGYGRWELFQKLAIFAKNSAHEIQAYTECFVQHCINTDYGLMGESHFDLIYTGLPPDVTVAYDTANLCRIILKDTMELVQQETSTSPQSHDPSSNNNGTSDNNIPAVLKVQSSSNSFFPGEHLKVSVEFQEAKPPSGAPLFVVVSYQEAAGFLFGPNYKDIDYNGSFIRAYPVDSSLTADISVPGFVGNYSIGLVYAYHGKQVRCNVASSPTFSIKADPTLDASYQQLLQRNATTNTKRLLLLRDLLILFQQRAALVMQLPDISRGPTEWWSSQCDKLLLKLAYEYGYCTSKNFMAMKEEFANTIPNIPDEQFPPPKLLAKRLHRVVSWLVTRDQRAKRLQQQPHGNALPTSVTSQLQAAKPQDGNLIHSMMQAVAQSDKQNDNTGNDHMMDTDQKPAEEPLMIYVRFNNEFILFKVHANLALRLITDKLKDMDPHKRDVQLFTETGTELLPSKKIGEYNLVNNQSLTAKIKSVKLQLTVAPAVGLNLPNALPVRKYTIKAADTLEMLIKHYFQNYAYPLPSGVDLFFMFQEQRLKPSQVAESAGLRDGDTILVTMAVKKLKVTLVMPNRLLQPAEFARKEPFGSIIQTICQKFNLTAVKLFYREKRILDTECSEDLNIQDDDVIIVAISDAINILVPSLDTHKATIEYKIYIDKPLQLLMKDYCSRFKMAEDQIKFMYNNLVLKPSDTPCSIGLNEGYSIIPSIAYFNVVVKTRPNAEPVRQDTFTIAAKDNMKVLFQACAQKWGVNGNDLDFFFLGRKVEPTYLPSTLKIVNGSELTVHYVNEIEQGSNGLGDEMKVIVEGGHQRPVTFILYSSSPLEKMIEVYPRVLKLKENQIIQFLFNGRLLQSCNTPFGVGLKTGDSVQAFVKTIS